MADAHSVDFDDLDRLLTVAGTSWGASEAHGAFCGMACLAGARAIDGWLREIIATPDAGDVLAAERTRELKEVAAHTILSLEAGDMGFSLVLPGDEEPLPRRALGLADWCHGFMHGLATAGGADEGPGAAALDETLPQEILEDFNEITRAGADDSGDEEAESAYVELVEYVRVSAQLVYDETAALRNPGKDERAN